MSATFELRYYKAGYRQVAVIPYVPGQPLRVYLRQRHLISERLRSRLIDFCTRRPLRMAHVPRPGDIIEMQ